MTGLPRLRQYMLLSLVGGALVLLLAILGQDLDATVKQSDRWLLTGALLLASALGLASVFRPNWRRSMTAGPEGDEGPASMDDTGQLPGPPRRGHHPECEQFASHTIIWGGKLRCAGCTGLAIGAFAVVSLVAIYGAGSSSLRWWEGVALVMIGLSLVTLDLGAALMGPIDPRVGLALNALMVVGFALVAIGLLEATGLLAWGLVGVVLSVLWMDTRIQLSRWNHAAVCTVCPEGCIAYSF